MRTIWCFTPWSYQDIGWQRVIDHCAIINSEEIKHARPAAGKIAPDSFPTAQLKISLEDLCLDCFSLATFTLVSQDLRDAMALGPQDVQFLPVDASLSSPLPRSKNYMIMHMPVIEDVSDVDQSDYGSRHGPGGSVKIVTTLSIAINRNADPKHEIFRDRFFSDHVFCTDGFALRLLWRRCTGVHFYAPGRLYPPQRFRTLRGIEEEEWDPVRNKYRRRLVQEL